MGSNEFVATLTPVTSTDAGLVDHNEMPFCLFGFLLVDPWHMRTGISWVKLKCLNGFLFKVAVFQMCATLTQGNMFIAKGG